VSEPTNQEQKHAAKVRRGQVVSFRFHDAVTGRDLDGVGVVLGVEDGGNVTVRPLSASDLTVDPADVSAVAAGDVTA
jgi:hypothetical protein